MNLTTTRPIEKVLDRLPDAQPDGHGYKAKCPSHDDHNPSLAITEADDGKVLLRCWSGCKTEAIVDALGLKMGDLFTKSDRPTVTPHKPTKMKPVFASSKDALLDYEQHLGPRSATWIYHDQTGKPVGIVARWNQPDGKKTIRPVSLNCSGWKQEGLAEPRPLYRLPEVLAATGRIYVCEGEGCADAFKSIGLVATTSPHGAQSANKADWSVLAGKQEIILVPDNDSAGEKYAVDVASQLAKLSPRPTKILRLPNLPAGGDIVDWIGDHGDAATPDALRLQIETMADAAKTIEPSCDAPRLSASAQPTKQAEKPRLCRQTEPFRPFPTDILPPPLRQFAVEHATAIDCCESFVVLPMLSVLAASIGNTRRIRLKRSWTEPSIIWTGLVANSGARKSPPVEVATRPIRDRQAKSLKLHAQAMEDYERAVAEHTSAARKYKGEGEPPRKPEEPIAERHMASDLTIEALGYLLRHQPRGLLVCRDELDGWLGGFDQYKSGKGSDLANWLEMHGGRSVTIDRKTGTSRTLFIPRASVSLCGGIQPGVLSAKITGQHVASGLVARLLFASPPPRPRRWTDADVDDDITNSYSRIVDNLLSIQFATDANGEPEPALINLSADARRRFARFVNEHGAEHADLDDALSASFAKLEGYAARFSLVLHLARWASGESVNPMICDQQSVESGIILSSWFANEAKRIHGMLHESEDETALRQLSEWISRRGGKATARDVYSGNRRYPTSEDAELALNQLVASKAGQWQAIPTGEDGGRPSREFCLQAVCTTYLKPEENGVVQTADTTSESRDEAFDNDVEEF